MKKINYLLVLVLLAIATQIPAQRYLEPIFDEVQVTYDTTYGVNATILLQPIAGEALPEELKMDVYEPVGDDVTERPLVIILHTGNFLPIQLNNTTNGVRTDSTPVEIATRLAQYGYVAAVASYRLGWNPTAETQPERALGLIQASYRGLQDARNCIRFFKNDYMNDNGFGVDTSRITVWGIGTGGYISLGVATLDDFTEIATTTNPPGKFLTDLDGDPSTLEPMVIPSINGNIDGTDVGIVPPTGLPPFPPGDTLNYPNLPGISSDFQLCVNMGGALGDISWLEAGDVPMITYQTPTDPFAPYDDAVLVVPTTGDPIVQVQGGKFVIETANTLGNNDIFIGIDDEYTQQAMTNSTLAGHDYFEGLYPFPRATNALGQEEGDPWNWWSVEVWDAIDHPSGFGSFHDVGLFNNLDMSGEKARLYIDTVMGYFAPRAYATLDLLSSTEELIEDATFDLMLSPNPASDIVLIQSDANHPILDIQVFDLNGALVQSSTNIKNYVTSIPRRNLPPGMYVVKMRFEEGVISKKIIFK